MAGYTAPTRTFKLTFDDPKFEGLEVRVRSASLGTMILVSTLIDVRISVLMSAEDRAKADQLFGLFVDYLVEWNITDKAGDVVPQTLEGLHSLDPEFAMDVITHWSMATTGYPQAAGPLDDSSTSGDPSLEASLPMEPSSASPPS